MNVSSFLGITGAAVAPFAGNAAYSYRETFHSNLSYKVYIKRSPKKNKTKRIKFVYCKNKNFKGKTTTRITDKSYVRRRKRE